MQETHGTLEDTEIWEKELNCKLFMSPGNKASRGAAIAISNNIDYKFVESYADSDGRLIGVKIQAFEENLILVSVYFPTKDKQKEQLKLLEKLTKYLANFENDSIILGGDFNIVLDPFLDKQGEPRCMENQKNILKEP